MSYSAETEVAAAKAKFAEALDDFDPLMYIQKKPMAAAGLALAAGVTIGLLRFSKVKTVLMCSPLLGVVKKIIRK